MSEDWESRTVIGRNARGGGSSNGPSVIRGNANRAAALKNSGVAVGTEKKYATGNKGGPSDGQRMTMLDRSDDIVAQKTVPREVKLAIADGRKNRLDREGNPEPVNQSQLAKDCNIPLSVIQDLEDLKKTAQPPEYSKRLGIIARYLGTTLQGAKENIGKQKLTKTQQIAVDARKKLEKEEAKKAKEEAKRIKEEEEAAAAAKEEEEAAAKAKEEEEETAAAEAEEEEEKPVAKAKGKGKAKADEEDEEE